MRKVNPFMLNGINKSPVSCLIHHFYSLCLLQFSLVSRMHQVSFFSQTEKLFTSCYQLCNRYTSLRLYLPTLLASYHLSYDYTLKVFFVFLFCFFFSLFPFVVFFGTMAAICQLSMVWPSHLHFLSLIASLYPLTSLSARVWQTCWLVERLYILQNLCILWNLFFLGYF